MNQKALDVLEYNKIIELLKAEAGSEMTRQVISELRPYTDARAISEELRSTTEAVDLIVRKGVLPTGGIYDIGGSVEFARKGGTLTMKQLLQVHFNMGIASRVVSFVKSDVPPMPIITSMTELLVTMPRLYERIDRSIISEDEMSDNASPELRDIRRAIGRANDSIKTKLNHIINSSANRTYLQDAIVTMRNGRYVVPVKQEYRGNVPGIVHDQSKAGATLFIEPQAVVNLNNELRELELAEQAEIAKILGELSSAVAEHYHDLKNNQELLVQLDFIMAKGKLSGKMRGEAPVINDKGILDLKQGRHPLIDPKKVVPINVVVGGRYRSLVVTEPNTGGKTVTLKTVGLLAMMAQSGLHIPASGTSQLPIYTNIFADIGDEQSIEQSLSTFSSHMKNIVHIVEAADENSLVLIDELGAGTDPTEGAALAISILERLYDKGATILATTHYNEIKKYALSTVGVENASMEFDVETLSPTYKLSIGIPGRSNAFEISKKLGLSGDIIDRAGQLIERKDIEFEDVIGAIEEDKKRAEEERDEAIRISVDMKKKQEELEKELADLKKKKEKVLADAREEAREMLREARETANEVQKELKALAKAESLGERNKRFDQSRKKLKEKEGRYAEKIIKQVNANPVKASQLKVGDRVKVLSLDQNGEILTLPDNDGNLQVKIGIMKANLNVDDLMLIVDGTEKKKKPKAAGKSYGSLYKTKAQNVSVTYNCQGQNLEDAMMNVEKYLDDAYVAGLEEVTIIHGRGEGILSSGLRQMMKKQKHVASFRKGNYNEGGDGVTVVKLKKT
ncbi:MAG: endonuclease MutS2 [Firmicutes bacterium]|nr:endonuclease MutS2 [Bacillota bacterium]